MELKIQDAGRKTPETLPPGAVVYYLIFASHKPVAARIVQDIFAKHRERRG